MSSLNDFKASFSSLYTEETPHAYFSAMEELEYQIPRHATPVLNALIECMKRQRPGDTSVLDLGCSYGVLSALVRSDIPLTTLYERYQISNRAEASITGEAEWYAHHPARCDVTFYGLDASPNAIAFATRVGLLKDGLTVDLEDPRTQPDSLSRLPRVMDLVVSTGCVGYITDVTFEKLLGHLDKTTPPVFANFVLRAFDYSDIAKTLASHGFRTTKLADTTFVQRRFRDREEQERILSLLAKGETKPDTSPMPEQDGYYHAELFLSLHDSADAAILDGLHEALNRR